MEEQEIHLRDYLNIIRKRKGIIATFFVLTFVTAAIGTYTATPMYSASANVLIEKSEKNDLMVRSPYSAYDYEFQETQRQLIQSFNVAKRVVEDLSLDTKYKTQFFEKSAAQAFISEKKAALLQPAIDGVRDLLSSFTAQGAGVTPPSSPASLEEHKQEMSEADQIASSIMGNLTVKLIEESRIVEISYLHQNPIIAQMVTNAIAKAYKDEVLEMRMSNSSYTIKWMSEKALEERTRLEESEKKLQQYQREANILTLENKLAIIPEKLQELGSRLSSAMAKRNEWEVLVRKLDAIGNDHEKAESIAGIAGSTFYHSIQSKILEADQRRKELAKKYGHKHPKMIQANEELALLNAEKDNEIKKQIETIKNNYELANSEVVNLERMLESTKEEAQRSNKGFIQYDILKRDVETNRVMYEALLAQVKEQKVSEEISNINVWITKAATTPKSPAKPNNKRNLLLGCILGVFGGIGFAFFLEYLDNTIQTPDELEAKLGVSVLGLIDKVKPEKLALGTQSLLEGEDGFSSFGEGMKVIRTAILLSAADTPPKRILLTSSIPQEGKTTTTVNLAHTFALAGYKVVIVDADLRKPRIHKVLGLDNTKGLSAYLAGIDDSDIINHATNVENLSIIPAGPMPPNPSELLVSDRFATLLASLEKDFDFIFIDSAPLFSATETLFISKIARPILVIKAGSTTYDLVRQAFAMLDDAKVSPLGVILNAVDRKKTQYGYGPYRYYGYYTGSSKT